MGATRDPAIREASGLAASTQTPGLYWTVNDSGNFPVVFAVDGNGSVRATLEVSGAENTDWEAIAVGPGADGRPALYIGDIGDNRSTRRQVTIYRVAEPDLPPRAEPLEGRTAEAEAFRASYPDGSLDAEALLVHPATGDVVIVTKDHSGQGNVYRIPQPLQAAKNLMAEQLGSVDFRALGPLAGAVTDGAVAPDGGRVVLRTYLAAAEYDLNPETPLGAFVRQTPRFYQLQDGPQGEGITYRSEGRALLSITEGSPAALFQTPWRCD